MPVGLDSRQIAQQHPQQQPQQLPSCHFKRFRTTERGKKGRVPKLSSLRLQRYVEKYARKLDTNHCTGTGSPTVMLPTSPDPLVAQRRYCGVCQNRRT
jgi:hypothetical protein